MSFAEFSESLAADAVPPALAAPLRGLWYAGRGDWDAAHRCVQADRSRDGCWVHAYLHREEGDLGNAGYWYAKAGRPMPATGTPLKTEWAEVARALLAE